MVRNALERIKIGQTDEPLTGQGGAGLWRVSEGNEGPGAGEHAFAVSGKQQGG